jgi:hypothetical protein
MTVPGMRPKELAARIKGTNPDRVDDPTPDDISCRQLHGLEKIGWPLAHDCYQGVLQSESRGHRPRLSAQY